MTKEFENKKKNQAKVELNNVYESTVRNDSSMSYIKIKPNLISLGIRHLNPFPRDN